MARGRAVLTWHHLKTFLWLRRRLRANQARRTPLAGRLIQAVLNTVIVAAGVVMFVAFLLVGLFVLDEASPLVVLLVWDGLLGTFLLFWAVGLVAELQRSEMLSVQKFLQLPVPPQSVFVINYLGAIVLTPDIVAFVPGMIGLSIGLVLSRGSSMLALFPLVVGFVVLVTAVTHQFQGWLAALMTNKRRRRSVIAVVTLATTAVALLGSQAQYITERVAGGAAGGRSAEIAAMREGLRELRQTRRAGDISETEYTRQAEAIRNRLDPLNEAARVERSRLVERVAVLANRTIPLGWLPYGSMTLAQGRMVPSVLGFTGLMLIGLASLVRSYRTTMRLYLGDTGGPAAKARGRAAIRRRRRPSTRPRSLLLEWRLPGLSEHAAIVGLASFQSLTRAPEARLLLLTSLIIASIFTGMLLQSVDAPSLFIRPLLSTGVFTMVLLGLNQLAGNLFGFDRDGFRAFVLGAAPRKDVLLGKNLALMPAALGLGVAVLGVMQWVIPMRVDHFFATLAQMASMYLVYCLLLNLFSIFAPMPVKSGSLQPVKPKGLLILLNIVTVFLVPLALAPILLPLGIEAALDFWAGLGGIPVYLPLTLVEAGVVAVVYPRLLAWEGRLLQAREQRILEAVTVKAE